MFESTMRTYVGILQTKEFSNVLAEFRQWIVSKIIAYLLCCIPITFLYIPIVLKIIAQRLSNCTNTNFLN